MAITEQQKRMLAIGAVGAGRIVNISSMFKGQRPQEYAWFAISDSLPLAPELFSDTMALINQLLPAPSMRDGDVAREGREISIAR